MLFLAQDFYFLFFYLNRKNSEALDYFRKLFGRIEVSFAFQDFVLKIVNL